MSLRYLKAAVAAADFDALIRYVRLHLGDGDETMGRREIDKAWCRLCSRSWTCRRSTASSS